MFLLVVVYPHGQSSGSIFMKVGIFHIILTQEQKDNVKSTELRCCLMGLIKGRVKGCKCIVGW